jgi:hypothetical protein
LHQITHMQRKLLLMQATKLIPGYPLIDPETLMKELDVPNWGYLDGDTIQAKVKSFMDLMKNFQLEAQIDQAKVQMMIQQMMMAANPQAQLLQQLSGLSANLGQDLSNNSKDLGLKRGAGRPPDFKEAPELQNRGDRTTITGS